jgi:4-amino-4-deoxy-L-arabinose transferase-like glycosyltransferase
MIASRVLSPRVHAIVRHPAVGVFLVYLLGIALRAEYTLHVHPPEAFISSDMELYVSLAHRLAGSGGPLQPWDVTHPLGYPALLAFLLSGGGSLSRVADLQIVVSCLVPLALGLLGEAAFGRRTALAAIAFASLYFPFIEYGALFLSEIHFILCLTLAFASFFGARRARARVLSLGLAAAGGLLLSMAVALKSVGLPAALAFFVADAVALVFNRSPGDPERPSWRARLQAWLLRGAVAAIAAAPLLGLLSRVCTRANRGNFCVTGNKVGSDFLLGHYGPIADIAWAPEQGHSFLFGSPSAYLRHYENHVRVPFPMTDNAANSAEAWRWIFGHPFEALVLSLDHLYDTFFGVAMWPTFNTTAWPYAHLSQYAFVVLLFVPTLLACAGIARRGSRALVTSRTALVLSPVVALAVTVAIATGEVRYRIPFDIFFIVVACAFAVGDLARVDGPDGAGARNAP